MSKTHPAMIDRICQQCGKSFRIRKTTLVSTKSPNKGIYCSSECYGLSNRVPLAQRFRDCLGDPMPNGCIPWAGAILQAGYGAIKEGAGSRKMLKAHRVAYELANGSIPCDLFVCHHCDHPWCVNPAHLFLGTTDDNMTDMVQKERQVRGSRVNTAKLTPDDVRTIRTRYASGETQKTMALEYGVHVSNVFRLIHHKTWRHIS